MRLLVVLGRQGRNALILVLDLGPRQVPDVHARIRVVVFGVVFGCLVIVLVKHGSPCVVGEFQAVIFDVLELVVFVLCHRCEVLALGRYACAHRDCLGNAVEATLVDDGTAPHEVLEGFVVGHGLEILDLRLATEGTLGRGVPRLLTPVVIELWPAPALVPLAQGNLVHDEPNLYHNGAIDARAHRNVRQRQVGFVVPRNVEGAKAKEDGQRGRDLHGGGG